MIGPRETDALWPRHLLNSALIQELIPGGSRVVDLGSGAGLPGVPLALARPDLHVQLVEPMARRCLFLSEVVADLGLAPFVEVIRGRADDDAVRTVCAEADIVTARALAPLDRLVAWALPLLRPGGRLLAIKGQRAEAELSTAAALYTGGVVKGIVHCGADTVETPTRVVVIDRRD